MQHVIDGHSVFARDAFCSKPTVAIRNIKATNVLLNDRWINKLPIRKTKNTNPRYQKLTFWENHKRFEKITDLVPLEWKNHWLGVPRGGKIIDFLRKSLTWTPRGGKITDFLRKSLTWTPRGEKITDFLRKSLTWIPRGGKITDFLRKSLTWIPRGEKITDLDPMWWENHWLGPLVVRKSLTWIPRGGKIIDLGPLEWKNHWLVSWENHSHLCFQRSNCLVLDALFLWITDRYYPKIEMAFQLLVYFFRKLLWRLSTPITFYNFNIIWFSGLVCFSKRTHVSLSSTGATATSSIIANI